MYSNYQIVVNTAAGRRRYMQYLIPFVVSSKIVDRYDIWINTHDGVDIEFFKQIANLYPKVNLVWQPDGVVNGIRSINAFYRQCIDENTIYFKLDDDIIWMEPDLIEKMVKFRVENPEYFVVSPLVVNNSLSTYLLQVHNKIKLNRYYNSMAAHPILWENGEFAAQLHNWFLNTQLKSKKYEFLHIGKQPMGMIRFSINCILWFGSEMKKMEGIIPGDDEEFLSCIYPTQHRMANCWNGDALVAHFAFFPQREQLDKENILQQYGEYLAEEWSKDEKMREIHQKVQDVMQYCSDHKSELEKNPSPYRQEAQPTESLLRQVYNKLPLPIRQYISSVRHKEAVKYIVE